MSILLFDPLDFLFKHEVLILNPHLVVQNTFDVERQGLIGFL
jgi:hypothetical protein